MLINVYLMHEQGRIDDADWFGLWYVNCILMKRPIFDMTIYPHTGEVIDD